MRVPLLRNRRRLWTWLLVAAGCLTAFDIIVVLSSGQPIGVHHLVGRTFRPTADNRPTLVPDLKARTWDWREVSTEGIRRIIVSGYFGEISVAPASNSRLSIGFARISTGVTGAIAAAMVPADLRIVRSGEVLELVVMLDRRVGLPDLGRSAAALELELPAGIELVVYPSVVAEARFSNLRNDIVLDGPDLRGLAGGPGGERSGFVGAAIFSGGEGAIIANMGRFGASFTPRRLLVRGHRGSVHLVGDFNSALLSGVKGEIAVHASASGSRLEIHSSEGVLDVRSDGRVEVTRFVGDVAIRPYDPRPGQWRPSISYTLREVHGPVLIEADHARVVSSQIAGSMVIELGTGEITVSDVVGDISARLGYGSATIYVEPYVTDAAVDLRLARGVLIADRRLEGVTSTTREGESAATGVFGDGRFRVSVGVADGTLALRRGPTALD